MLIRFLMENKKIVEITMMPIPPIWISNKMTVFPKNVKVVAVSTTVSPVTQTAEAAVNSASINGSRPWVEDTGSAKSRVPDKMRRAYPKMEIRPGEFKRLNARFPWVDVLLKLSLIIEAHQV